jgi:hypothetical protein
MPRAARWSSTIYRRNSGVYRFDVFDLATITAKISLKRTIARQILWTLAVEPFRRAMSSFGYVDCALAFRISRRMA